MKKEGITEENMSTAEDYGDYLLRTKKVGKEEYSVKQRQAKEIVNRDNGVERISGLVSVIMPSYNTGAYIREAIQSVQNQTYENWELLIVDDCSTDDTDKVLEGLLDERIKVFKNEKNSGAAISRNKALREARGQWVAYLDSDDLWVPEKLESR